MHTNNSIVRVTFCLQEKEANIGDREGEQKGGDVDGDGDGGGGGRETNTEEKVAIKNSTRAHTYTA